MGFLSEFSRIWAFVANVPANLSRGLASCSSYQMSLPFKLCLSVLYGKGNFSRYCTFFEGLLYHF